MGAFAKDWLQFFAALIDRLGAGDYRVPLVTLISTLVAVWALGEVTEMRKPTVKRWVTAGYEAVAQFSG